MNTHEPRTESDLPFQRLTIIGLGLIGGSLAMAARSVYPSLWIQAVDSNADALQYALKSNLVDAVSLTLPEQFETNHLIVLSTHLQTAETLLQKLAQQLAERAPTDIALIDVGSCKRAIFSLGRSVAANPILAAHPMAGKEFSGIHSATALLFAGKAFLLCPNPLFPPELQSRIQAFLSRFGALPRVVDPDTHDRAMAYVSHLPQLYAIALTHLLAKHEPAKLLSLHGGGIDDQLRLAASPYAMWSDIYEKNADNVQTVLEELIETLSDLKDALGSPVLENRFKTANTLHQVFQTLKQPVV